MSMSSSAIAFSSAAAGYDRDFGALHGVSGLRRRVLRLVDTYVAPGSLVLEIGCGTGEDALALHKRGYKVTATDVSPGMAELARTRLAEVDVPVHVVSAEAIPVHFRAGTFDAVFSNFGALNCVSDLAGRLGRIANLVKPGGVMILCLIGKFSLWEMLSGAFRFRMHVTTRRMRSAPVAATVGDRRIKVWYYSVRALTKSSGGKLETLEIEGLNVVSPPPGSSTFIRSHPRLTRLLDRLDPALGRLPVMRALGDHVVLVLRLRNTPNGPLEKAGHHDH